MIKAAVALVLAFVFTVSSMGVHHLRAAWDEIIGVTPISENLFPTPAEYSRATTSGQTPRYLEYMQMHEHARFTGASITLGPDDLYTHSEHVFIELFEGMNSIITEEIGYITFRPYVAASGWYAFEIDYFPIVEHTTASGRFIAGTGGSIERTVYLNGMIPFDEAFAMQLTRIYVDILERNYEGDEYFYITGSRFRPRQEERPRWNTEALRDPFGYFGRAIYFYLEAGYNQITFRANSEPMAISEIRLISESFSAPSYADRLAQWQAQGIRPVVGALEGGQMSVAAEVPYEKGDPTLFAFNDTLSTRTYPHDPRVRRMNAIGGELWQFPHQWISWEVYVPEAGLYNFSARVRQNFSREINSNRTILINDELQFAEAAFIEFPYGRSNNGWYTLDFADADGTPFYFYFQEGRNIITLKVTAGNVTDVLTRAHYVMDNLARINLHLISIMTTRPDRDRDFNLLRRMPEIVGPNGELAYNADLLRGIAAEMMEMSGGRRDTLVSQIERLATTIDMMVDRPDRIASNFRQFRDQLPGFGTWTQTVREHALVVDRLIISESGVEVTVREDNFFNRLWATIIGFINTFFTTFSMIGDPEGDEYITVWIGGITGGRDQAMALNSMVERDFTERYGIPVNLQLVGTGVVLVATLAGRGPDVTLSVTRGEPVDFALRNAVVDLTQFPDFEQVAGRWDPEFGEFRRTPRNDGSGEYDGRFFPGTVKSFQLYRETGTGIPGVYALPEIAVWPMMFYRTDVLQDLGVNPSEDLRSWQSIREIYPSLLAENKEFGLPAVFEIFLMFLYQSGGQLYRDGLVAVNFDDPLTLETFRYFTSFYLEAGMPRDFDFVNRFRTGEMPIGVMGYDMFNMISIFAPEIRGRWNMVPVPGFEIHDEDGNLIDIVNVVSPIGLNGGVGGAIIMAGSDNIEDAWTFLKWWTDSDAQFNFGRHLEAVMGAAARHATANVYAFRRMPWSGTNRQNLEEQAMNMMGIPEAPGGYYVGRHFGFAMNDILRDRVHERQDARQRLLRATIYINNEITRRREEFGFSLDYRR